MLAAGTGRAPGALHTITGGNPFFVSEALAAGPDEVPSRVADLVLSRMHQLSPSARAALEQLSVIPTLVPLRSCDCVAREAAGALAEAESAGLVERARTAIAFRHELARRAIGTVLPVLRRRVLNPAVVRALRDGGRIDGRGSCTTRWRRATARRWSPYAPAAAREASDAGVAPAGARALRGGRAPYAGRLRLRTARGPVTTTAWELYNAHRFEAGGRRRAGGVAALRAAR